MGNNYRAFSVLALAVTALGLSSCNYTRMKNNGDDKANNAFGTITPTEKATVMNYSYINENIIKPKCTSCHGNSGGVNLENYDNVFTNRHNIHQAVFAEGIMPPKGKGILTDDEKRLLWNWLDMGCPKESPNGGSGNTPPPEDLKATYDSINKNIFQNKCVSCHKPGEDGERVSLAKKDLLNSPLELVIPENPDESGLVIAIERTDDKRMPLAKEGYGPLSDKEKEVIRNWIANGAKD